MRKIVIEFELPEDIEADYSDVHPQLVFEDLFPSQIGFRVVSDTVQQSVRPTVAKCAPDQHDLSNGLYCAKCGDILF